MPPQIVPVEAWTPQAGPQTFAIQQYMVPELFFGGAVGGGKSDYLLGDFGYDVHEYGSAWQGILFRKNYPDLEELVARSLQIYPKWFPGSKLVDHDWRFGNGAILKFRHAEDENSWVKYQGHQYTWIGYDELPHWPTPTFWQELKTRLRSAHGVPCLRVRGTGNPGGVGHGWIKKHFAIDKYPLGSVLIPEDIHGDVRMFVRSKLTDNLILMERDPKYITRLSRLGNKERVQMYLDGDWNVIAGAFFTEFSVNKHVVQPFEIPKDWLKIRAADWGSASPFCVLWATVAEDGAPYGIPRGALVFYREWYGAHPDRHNTGLKMTAEEVASGIREREGKEKIPLAVIDPSAFKSDGGPSIGERMGVCPAKVIFARADNSRKVGWDMVRQRLKGNDGEAPMIYFFTTCPETIRTLPMLQHDLGKKAGSIEDVDTNSEDHAGDTVRYLCMARPWTRRVDEVKVPEFRGNGVITIGDANGRPLTFNDIISERTRKRRNDE